MNFELERMSQFKSMSGICISPFPHRLCNNNYVFVIFPATQFLSSKVYRPRDKIEYICLSPCEALKRPNPVKSFTLYLSLETGLELSLLIHILIQPVNSFWPFAMQARTLLFGACTAKIISTTPFRVTNHP